MGRRIKFHLLKREVPKICGHVFKSTIFRDPTQLSFSMWSLPWFFRAELDILLSQFLHFISISYSSCLIYRNLFTFSPDWKLLPAKGTCLINHLHPSLLIDKILRPPQDTATHHSWDRIFKRPFTRSAFLASLFFLITLCIIYRHAF